MKTKFAAALRWYTWRIVTNLAWCEWLGLQWSRVSQNYHPSNLKINSLTAHALHENVVQLVVGKIKHQNDCYRTCRRAYNSTVDWNHAKNKNGSTSPIDWVVSLNGLCFRLARPPTERTLVADCSIRLHLSFCPTPMICGSHNPRQCIRQRVIVACNADEAVLVEGGRPLVIAKYVESKTQ